MVKVIQKESFSQTGNTVILNDMEFKRLSNLIVSKFGIKMPESKKSLLQGRLQKRLKALGLKSFRDYNDYLFSMEGINLELPKMIDEVSTNKTDFFREQNHFDFLVSGVMNDYLNSRKKRKKIDIWSAGCSTGEEPYSIAMILEEYLPQIFISHYHITATDISTRVLDQAVNGMYPIHKVSMIPTSMRKKYFLKGKNSYSNNVLVKGFLKRNITFQPFNLLSSNYHLIGKQDVIFCRNVLIYFDRSLQLKILNSLCRQLNPGGFLFLGHSESIIGFNLPLIQIKPTIYQQMSG